MKPVLQKLLPHIIAIALFAIVAILFCKPALEGKVLNQHDTQGWKGMAQQSFEVKKKTGHLPLWTNSMFGGMPAYQIAMEADTHVGDPVGYFFDVLKLGLPESAAFFFVACICFYFLCIILGVNPWLSVLGGLAYAYATYNPIIVSVGHNTKMMAMALAPMVLGGLQLLFRKKYLAGLLIISVFSSLMIGQNHMQIVYYTLIIAGIMVVCYIIHAARNKELVHAIKASVLGLVGGLIGLACCAVSILPTYEYSKETMRGGVSQLTDTTGNKTKGGLDKDYALRWSLGKMETFTFMIPGIYGGSNGGNEHKKSALSDLGIPDENAIGISNAYSYWGNMSSLSETTSGPPYLGAVICCLFIFGLFYLSGWQKWWMVAASIFGILLGWGNSLEGFNHFMLDYMPFLSKFRAPSMAMVIPQLCIPLLAVLALNKLVQKNADMAEAWKKLRYAAIATGVVVLIAGAFYLSANYTGKGDPQIKENFLQQFSNGQSVQPEAEQRAGDIMKALREDRKSQAGSDLMRSVLFMAVALVLLGLYIKSKFNALVLSVSLIVVTMIDLIGVDTRYFNYEKFMEKDEVESTFTPSPADQQILKDPDHANFRVFNQSPGFTSESLTSYFHNSIGGYHPAKLGLYQDIIEHQISKGNVQVLNMLNTKYVIGTDMTGRPIVQMNPAAFGSCWLVKGIKYVNNADMEMQALDSTNLRDTAVMNASFKNTVKQEPVFDSTAFIRVKERENDQITYDFSATQPQFAVFSEVYYSAGWNAFIDGQKVPYAKVNYVLRGLSIPAGKHTVVFKFEPRSYYTGRQVSIWATVLVYVIFLAWLLFYIREQRAGGNKKEEQAA